MIALFGGTFDPIHNGHLHVIKELLGSKRFEKIIVIPSGDPQLRAVPIASSKDRLAIVQLAIADLKLGDLVEVSDYEITKDEPSFAIDTARYFMKIYPDQELSWIIGSDAYSKVDQWRESEALRQLISFIVIERPAVENSRGAGAGATKDQEDDDGYDSYGYEDIDALSISATDIREKLSKHESIADLTVQSVERYIIERNLYGSA